MKRSVIMMAALTFILALFVPLASAQTQPAAQDPAKEEADAYKAWYDANAAKDLPKALTLAKVYIEKYPNGQNVAYLKDKWLPQTLGYLFNQAVQSKNMAEMIRFGREAMASNPDNLDYLIAMSVQLSTNELYASPPNYTHATDMAEFTERAIRLIESGKTPSGDPSKFDKNKTVAYFHRTLALIDDHNKNADKALEHYMEAAKLEPMNSTNYFQCGRLHQAKYLAAATKYQSMPQADRDAAPAEMKPDVKAALDDLNKEADAVINCWVRFLGLTATDMKGWESLRPQVQQTVTDLYKYRNNDSTAGLDKLIEQNKGAAPVSMPPPSAAPATTAPAAAAPAATDQSGMSAKPGSAPAKSNAAPAKPNGKKPRR